MGMLKQVQHDDVIIVRLPDIWLFLPAILLTCLGLIVTTSIVPYEFKSQLIFVLFSIGVFIALSNFDFRLLHALSVPIFGFELLLLLVTLITGLHIRGSRRWLSIAGVNLQTSELMKPVLILGLSYLCTQINVKKFSHYILTLAVIALPALFVFIQPDLGTTIVLLSIGGFMLLGMKPAKKFLILSGLSVAVMLPIFWHSLAPYQKARVDTFLNPQSDPLGASYNQIQAVIAVGSGQFFGKGLGRGTQSHLHFLPEKHTDFFFASLAEEFGFLGTVVVVGLFFMLTARLLYLAQQTEDKVIRLIFLGTFTLFFIQSTIHIAINLGIAPVTGITLPFLSVGGSSALASWIALGLASSASREVKPRNAIFLR